MNNEILINAAHGEIRVAVLEKGQFSELHIERPGEGDVVGRVIKGRVNRVLPGMQAAFVDIGLEKAAFLYVGDYIEDMDPSEVEVDDDEPAPRGRRRGRNRQQPKIETVLHEGKEIAVQVAKEPIGTKGARITSNISIAGRHLVLTPWSRRVGVSRRIDSDRERRRLREIVERLRPRDVGFITRTAGDGVRESEIEADIKYLTETWESIQDKRETAGAPEVLYAEPSLPIRVIRDLASSDTKRIVVDSPEVFAEMREFVDRFLADPKPAIELYEGVEPIFDHFGLEPQIDANIGRKVWLKSGGYLIVDQSEALTAIDVNTGSYVGKRDLEETVLKTNLEAVKEVVNQLRFRNIGGLIIIDLIDMESNENREKVYRALQEAIRNDKARTNILKISELGLVEMTRKRTRENLVQTLCEPCGYCDGKGYVLSEESVTYKVLRGIQRDLPRFSGRQIAVSVSPRVAEHLLGRHKDLLAGLEQMLGREIEIRARPGLHQEQFEIVALDAGPPIAVDLAWLAAEGPAGAASDEDDADEDDDENGDTAGNGASPPRGRRRGGRGRRRGGANGRGKLQTGSDDEPDGADPSAESVVTDDADSADAADSRDSATPADAADDSDATQAADGDSDARRGREGRDSARLDGMDDSSGPAEPGDGRAAGAEPAAESADDEGSDPDRSFEAASSAPLDPGSRPLGEDPDASRGAVAVAEPAREGVDDEPRYRILPGPQEREES